MEDRKQLLVEAETWIVKVGSRSLTGEDGRLDRGQVANLARQLIRLADAGKRVVLVSSGAVASGVGRLGLPGRPTDLATLQAVAAIGQTHLIQVYEQTFAEYGRVAAQVLLTASELDDRVAYLNTRNTLRRLLELGAIPIINENDTVAVDELKTTFGDNDRLAGMVAGLLEGSLLVILSDVRGLYDRDPSDPDARVLPLVEQIDESIDDLVRDRKTGISKGGMASKLTTAKFVTLSGQGVVIAWGRETDVLVRLSQGEELGTVFMPQSKTLAPRKRWIGFSAQPSGILVVDDGAVRAMKGEGRSLLAIGIQSIVGDFGKGDIVSVQSSDSHEIARGLVNYNAEQLRRIQGCRSDRIQQILGQCPYEEVIHRDNLTVI
ncbi:Glutamate 5-kinase [Pirellula sp. SH-Sr6A]|uniref:glutamate 5-kinase n=1 Tax=Pirellula sp. SH-Sr6A TaxID=1632865 RepID=UPI00078ED4B4|nr:glutamate 5-kinase [Pirellula sp. SH-Sr6A]AMV33106.1 Glutamate 5-kinase [Pirellula sp. SH-Sr6A]